MTEDINLENLMKLAATGKPKRDTYYENTFRKMLSGKKYVWNKSSSLAGSVWLMYRKAYGGSLLMMASSIILSFVVGFIIGFLGAVLTGGDKSFDWIVISIVTIACLFSAFFFQGYMGNRFYLWSLKRKIKRGYNKASLKNTDRISVVMHICASLFTGVLEKAGVCRGIICYVSLFVILVLPRIIFVILNDRRKVRRALKN